MLCCNTARNWSCALYQCTVSARTITAKSQSCPHVHATLWSAAVSSQCCCPPDFYSQDRCQLSIAQWPPLVVFPWVSSLGYVCWSTSVYTAWHCRTLPMTSTWLLLMATAVIFSPSTLVFTLTRLSATLFSCGSCMGLEHSPTSHQGCAITSVFPKSPKDMVFKLTVV